MPGDGKCEESEVNGGHVRPTQKNKMIGKKLVMSEFLIRQNVFFQIHLKWLGIKCHGNKWLVENQHTNISDQPAGWSPQKL